jgi:anti-sigma factor RsiW
MTAAERFSELWTDYLEGDLDEAGVAELEALLAADESLRARAADLFQTHRLLGFALQDNPAAQEAFVESTLARVRSEEHTSELQSLS